MSKWPFYLVILALLLVFVFGLFFEFNVNLNMPDSNCSNFCGEQQDNNSVIHDGPVLRYLDDDVAQSDNDGITRNMEVKNPEGQFSGISFISGGKYFIKLFSALSISDVTWLWNDICVLENTSEIREVNLYINSPGGDAFSGLALADHIESAKKRGFNFTAYASGIVASAAVPIFAVCNKRIATPGTIFMVHESALWKWPGRETSSDIKAQNELLDLLRERYIGKLATYSKLSYEKWCDLEKKTTWFSAQMAKEWGLVDRIE